MKKLLCMLPLSGLMALSCPMPALADSPNALATVSIHSGYGEKLRGLFHPATGIVTLPVVVSDSGVFAVDLKLVDGPALILEVQSIISLDPAVLPGLTSAPASLHGNGTLTIPEVEVNGVVYAVVLPPSASSGSRRFSVTSTAVVPPAVGNDSAMLALQGYFADPGIGQVISIANGTLTSYEITEASCMFNLQNVPVSALLQTGTAEVMPAEAGFSFRYTDQLLTLFFNRIDSLPTACLTPSNAGNSNVLKNFDIFWQTFDEHYPAFEKRGADWQALRSTYRNRLSASSSNQQLFNVLRDMTDLLDDAHVQVNSPFGNFNAGGTPEFRAARAAADVARNSAVFNNYLTTGLNSRLAGYIQFGMARDDILYLQLNSFEADERAAYLNEIDTILSSNPGIAGVVIDLRFNDEGGSDTLALQVAGRFTDRVRPAFKESSVGPDGAGPVSAYNIAPSGPTQFTGPVVVLTGLLTISAAENFALNMLALPQTTLIGSRTRGTLSTVMSRQLPNGFVFFLPFEHELAPDGTSYEVVGLPPDEVVENFDGYDISVGKDRALERALQRISEQVSR
jgi:carboxyl-terminal processing protease